MEDVPPVTSKDTAPIQLKARKDLKKIKSFDVDQVTGDLTPSEVTQDVKMEEPEKPIEHIPISFDDFDDIDDEGMYDSVQKVRHEPKHEEDDDMDGEGLRKRKGNKKLLKRFNAAVAELKQQRPGITHKQAQKLVSQYYHSN